MRPNAEATVTHAFLDARLEAVETRMDARIDRIEQKMDAFEQRIESRMGAFEHSLLQMQQSIQDVRTETHDAIEKRFDVLSQSMQQMQTHIDKSLASMKSNLLITAISTVVAIVLGVAAFNASVVGNVTNAFDSGRQTAEILAHIEAQQRQHDKLLQDLAQQVQQQRLRGS